MGLPPPTSQRPATDDGGVHNTRRSFGLECARVIRDGRVIFLRSPPSWDLFSIDVGFKAIVLVRPAMKVHVREFSKPCSREGTHGVRWPPRERGEFGARPRSVCDTIVACSVKIPVRVREAVMPGSLRAWLRLGSSMMPWTGRWCSNSKGWFSSALRGYRRSCTGSPMPARRRGRFEPSTHYKDLGGVEMELRPQQRSDRRQTRRDCVEPVGAGIARAGSDRGGPRTAIRPSRPSRRAVARRRAVAVVRIGRRDGDVRARPPHGGARL